MLETSSGQIVLVWLRYGNRSSGVGITGGSHDNTIGTNGDGINDAAERNIISANFGNGVYLSDLGTDGNTIAGNYIGVDMSGIHPLGNQQHGVYIRAYASYNTVGGLTATPGTGAGNVVSANGFSGIGTNNGSNNALLGNIVGLDAAGTVALGNTYQGVFFLFGGTGNILGGSVAGARNIVSGNFGTDGGVLIGATTSNSLIQGNYIGTDITGSQALGNLYDGVRILGGTDNTIGGPTPASANLISGNQGNGVSVVDAMNFFGFSAQSTGNSIQGNSIHSNGGLGIDLGNDGITSNDPGDEDAGANTLQNSPTIEIANPGVQTRVGGHINSHPLTTFTLDFYANSVVTGYAEGERWLGYLEITTDSSGNAAFDVLLNAGSAWGEFITVTATDPLGNTSEFSAAALNNVKPTTPIDSNNSINLVAEGATNGTVVGLTAFSTDPDGPVVVYSLTDNAGGRFAINSSTGVVTVNNGSLLDGPVVHTISIQASDSVGGLSTAIFEIEVTNRTPTANIDRYTADVFTLLQVDAANGVLVNDIDPAGAANDPLIVTTTGPFTTAEGATVTLHGDGSFTYNATTSGTLLGLAAGATIDDWFTYEISDGDGGVDTAMIFVTVNGASENVAQIFDDFCGDGSKVLVVRGSSLDDKIDVKFGSMAGEFKISIKSGSKADSMEIGSFKYDGSNASVTKVIVYGLDGDDDIKVHTDLDVNAWLFGGAGNDKLRGSKGDDLLVGGDGDDQLDGGNGRDFLIGGLGADKLKGQQDEDILIAGETPVDNALVALCHIMQEWTRRDQNMDCDDDQDDLIHRAQSIRDAYFMNMNASDGFKDELDGGSELDWFVADTDDDMDKIKAHIDDIFGLDSDWFNLD